MITRQIEAVIVRHLAETALAVVLLGPRQVCKTTLARRIAAQWPTGSVCFSGIPQIAVKGALLFKAA